MMNQAHSRWPLLLALVWLVTPPLLGRSPMFGQPAEALRDRSHGPIPNASASGKAADLPRLLSERLQKSQQWQQVQELLQKIDPQSLQNALKDPKQRDALQALVEKTQTQFSPEAVRDLEEWLKKLPPQQVNAPKVNQGTAPSRDRTKPAPSPPSGNDSRPNDAAGAVASRAGNRRRSAPLRSMPQPPVPANQPKGVNQWLMESMEKLANSPVLQNSPAFRQTIEDLAHRHLQADLPSMGTGDATYGEKIAQSIGNWMPSERFWNDAVLSKVRNLPLPSLSNIELPNLNFSKPSMPSLDMPSVSVPGPSSSGGETLFFSLATVAVVALVLWKLYGSMLRRRSRLKGPDWAQEDGNRANSRSLQLSPLASRQDLIRAFEQLALVKLGEEARSWNHLHLAASLGGDKHERRGLANHLASLYEQARYAPGDGPLPADALQIARRELAFLAGVEGA